MSYPQPSRNRHSRKNAFTAPDERRMGTEVEVSRFLGSVVRAMKPKLVVETGTYHADTAVQIGMALDENAALGSPGELWTFETDPAAFDFAMDALRDLASVRIYPCRLQEVDLPKKVDIAFVDSAYESRMADVATLTPRMAGQGLLFVHDAMKPPMADAVNAWRKTHRIIQFPTARGLALLQRRSQ